jgi:hypothetical protein
MPWAANMAPGGGAAVAKLIVEVPPSVSARTSSEPSRCRKAPLPGTAAMRAIWPRVPRQRRGAALFEQQHARAAFGQFARDAGAAGAAADHDGIEGRRVRVPEKVKLLSMRSK